MLTRTNMLDVAEVSCHSREEVEGGTIIRYMVRRPGETEWRPVKLFRPTEPVANEREEEKTR
jgi:hypothetical protein